jgi:hypothetical protein
MGVTEMNAEARISSDQRWMDGLGTRFGRLVGWMGTIDAQFVQMVEVKGEMIRIGIADRDGRKK